MYSEKATKFCEIFSNYIFDWQYIGQIIGGDFAKFYGLLRIYELYKNLHLFNQVNVIQEWQEPRSTRSPDVLHSRIPWGNIYLQFIPLIKEDLRPTCLTFFPKNVTLLAQQLYSFIRYLRVHNISHFKGLGMRYLHFEVRICQKRPY